MTTVVCNEKRCINSNPDKKSGCNLSSISLDGTTKDVACNLDYNVSCRSFMMNEDFRKSFEFFYCEVCGETENECCCGFVETSIYKRGY